MSGVTSPLIFNVFEEVAFVARSGTAKRSVRPKGTRPCSLGAKPRDTRTVRFKCISIVRLGLMIEPSAKRNRVYQVSYSSRKSAEEVPCGGLACLGRGCSASERQFDRRAHT